MINESTYQSCGYQALKYDQNAVCKSWRHEAIFFVGANQDFAWSCLISCKHSKSGYSTLRAAKLGLEMMINGEAYADHGQ